jgi:hypothetical protein
VTTRPISDPYAAGYRTRCGEWLLMDPDERNEWATWFERHGIDPHTLHSHLSVVVDDTHRTITYAAANDRGGVVARMVQLEAPALPFPAPGVQWWWQQW